MHAFAQQLASALRGRAALLCADSVDMPTQRTSWTCGYENMSSMLATLRARQPPEAGPSQPGLRLTVAEVQAAIVAAWAAGFDPESAVQLRGSALLGSKCWVGAPEALAAFGKLRVRCWLVEIVEPRGAGRAIVDVLSAYMRARAPNRRLPVLIQHSGHSRLALGVVPRAGEPSASAGAVVMRDPAQRVSPLRLQIETAAQLDGWQYQLVFMELGRLTDAEVHVRKGRPRAAAIWQAVTEGAPASWRYEEWMLQCDRCS